MCAAVWFRLIRSGDVQRNGRLSIPAHVDRPLAGGTHWWCGRKHRSPRARRLVRHDRAVCSEHVAVMGRGGVITWEAEISQVSCAGGECYVPRLASGLGRGLLDPGSQTVKRNQFVRNRTIEGKTRMATLLAHTSTSVWTSYKLTIKSHKKNL